MNTTPHPLCRHQRAHVRADAHTPGAPFILASSSLSLNVLTDLPAEAAEAAEGLRVGFAASLVAFFSLVRRAALALLLLLLLLVLLVSGSFSSLVPVLAAPPRVILSLGFVAFFTSSTGGFFSFWIWYGVGVGGALAVACEGHRAQRR